MKKLQLSPSVLAADLSCLGEEVRQVTEAGADSLHIDIMDGRFVQNITLGFPVIKTVHYHTDLPLYVHLMVEDPIRFIPLCASSGASQVSVHIEACEDEDYAVKTLSLIRSYGLLAGIALNPETPVKAVSPLLPFLDDVLIMTVNPGFGGQKYLPSSTGRIEETAQLLGPRKERRISLEVDGGIGLKTVGSAVEAGADLIVAGTAVFQNNIAENVRNFRELFNRYEQQEKESCQKEFL